MASRKSSVTKNKKNSMKWEIIDFDSIFAVRPSEAVDVEDSDDEQPSVKEIFGGEAKSPSALEGSSGVYGDFQLVGHGKQSNEYCGLYAGLKGCLNVDKHDLVTLDGRNYKNKVFRRIIHNSCNRPSCPICYVSWAMRAARKVAFILGEASKIYGRVEHIMASVPVKDYDLSFDKLRQKTIKVAKSRGLIGGSLVFHAFRYNRIRGWYWSPHFHILGIIFGGYGKCRTCKRKNNCLSGCGGFDDVSWRKFQVDGWYVKVLDPLNVRRSVRKTVSYELGHCSIKKNVKYFRVVTYFGVCSYRALKISDEARARWEEDRICKCPLCGSSLVDVDYVGDKPLITDRLDPDYKRDSWEDYTENGCVVYVERNSDKG